MEALPAGRNTHSKVELWQRSIYKNEPSAAKFFSAYKTIFMVFFKHFVEYIDYIVDFLAKARRSLGSGEETHGTLCARVSNCQSFCVHQSDGLLGP